MRKLLTLQIFTVALLSSVFLNITKAQQGEINLEIKKNFLVIAGSGTLDVGNILSNPIDEERILFLENILQIKDISGLCSGHYTTIQFSDLKDGNNSIQNDNISLNLKNVTEVAGTANSGISIGSAIYNQQGAAKYTTTYLNRDVGINCGYIGQYGTTGEMKINIPANQATGTYRGKIYYLLIDNN